jgi:hypothetical protein
MRVLPIPNKKALDSGESRFFSYRPEGVPELTVEVGIKNKEFGKSTGKMIAFRPKKNGRKFKISLMHHWAVSIDLRV